MKRVTQLMAMMVMVAFVGTAILSCDKEDVNNANNSITDNNANNSITDNNDDNSITDNNDDNGSDTPDETALEGLTFYGDYTDYYYMSNPGWWPERQFHLNFNINCISSTQMYFSCDISQKTKDSELSLWTSYQDYGSITDNVSYTFNNNTGTMTFSGGYTTEYEYDPNKRELKFEFIIDAEGRLIGGTIVLHHNRQ